MDRVDRGGFIIRAAQNNDRQIARGRFDGFESVQPVAVGQIQIREHQIGLPAGQAGQGRGQAAGHLQPEAPPAGLLQGVPQQGHIHRIVLHEQNFDFLYFHAN